MFDSLKGFIAKERRDGTTRLGNPTLTRFDRLQKLYEKKPRKSNKFSPFFTENSLKLFPRTITL
jgi:hypothetical protein